MNKNKKIKKIFSTEQEEFWAGSFGNEYTSRNITDEIIAGNIALFSKILPYTRSVHSIIEYGANAGLNLKAIRSLIPQVKLTAVEINEKASQKLKKIDKIEVFTKSILDFKPSKIHDLVLIKGVLIHLNPDKLKQVYELLYKTSAHYICIVEYYNPSPVTIPYRGHEDRLFKRDFAGELMDNFSDLHLVSYGFSYHRDTNFPQDDLTWFLLEKEVKK